MTLKHAQHPHSGTTLVETAVAVTLAAIFFGSILQVNGLCFRYIDASKESVAALQGIGDRLETLRNLAFVDLTKATAVQNLMVNPADGAEFAQKVTEVVTLSAWPTPNANNTRITRPPGASVTPTINSTDSNLSTATLVKVNVTYSWTMTFGGRPMSEQAETIISYGSKK